MMSPRALVGSPMLPVYGSPMFPVVQNVGTSGRQFAMTGERDRDGTVFIALPSYPPIILSSNFHHI
jgi:hypothetical protein